MSIFTAAQASSFAKSNLDVLAGLANNAFNNFEKLAQLNLQVAKNALAEGAAATDAVLGAKTLPDLLAIHAAVLQPGAEKAAAYGRAVYDIVSSNAAEVSEVAQDQLARAQKGFTGVVDEALKNAPAGSDSGVTLVKSAIAAANSACESARKATKQVTDLVEANITAVTNTAVKATRTAKKAA